MSDYSEGVNLGLSSEGDSESVYDQRLNRALVSIIYIPDSAVGSCINLTYRLWLYRNAFARVGSTARMVGGQGDELKKATLQVS